MPRLVRDRSTWLLYAQLAVWGFFLYGFGPVVPLLRDEQGTSAAVASLHGTGLAAGALLGGLSFPAVARRLGRGGAVWAGLGGTALGVAALCLVEPLPATLAAAVATATAGTLLISGVNVILTERHGAAGPAALSEANAACAGMGVLAPVVIGLAVGAGLGWRPAMAVEVALIAAVALAATLLRVRLPGRPGAALAPATTPVTPGGPTRLSASRRHPPMPRVYWLTWFLMAATGSVEVCLSLWAADVLRTHAGMAPGPAAAAVASVVAGMFIGRLVGGRVALRVAPAPLLLVALLVSFAGFGVFWLSPVGPVATAGLVVLGLGNAMHYPLAISMALAASGGNADRAAAYSSYSMAVAFGVAPVVLGGIADEIGPHLAFLLLPGFLAVAALLTVRVGRRLAAGVRAPGGHPVSAGEPA